MKQLKGVKHYKNSVHIAELKLIICYVPPSQVNIAEVCSGFHQADWSTTLVIVYYTLLFFYKQHFISNASFRFNEILSNC